MLGTYVHGSLPFHYWVLIGLDSRCDLCVMLSQFVNVEPFQLSGVVLTNRLWSLAFECSTMSLTFPSNLTFTPGSSAKS